MEVLYEWVWNVAVYLLLVTAVTNVLPGDTYRKYLKFFTGVCLVIVMTPAAVFSVWHGRTAGKCLPFLPVFRGAGGAAGGDGGHGGDQPQSRVGSV